MTTIPVAGSLEYYFHMGDASTGNVHIEKVYSESWTQTQPRTRTYDRGSTLAKIFIRSSRISTNISSGLANVHFPYDVAVLPS